MPFACPPPIAALAIFAALSSALLFVRGATVGAWRLLGRGRGFAGVSAAGGEAPFALPFAFGTTPEDFDVGARDGREPAVPVLRVPVREVVRVRVAGRKAGCREAAEGGRAREGREEDVPLKDCRDEERDGTEGAEDPRTVAGKRVNECCNTTKAHGQ